MHCFQSGFTHLPVTFSPLPDFGVFFHVSAFSLSPCYATLPLSSVRLSNPRPFGLKPPLVRCLIHHTSLGLVSLLSLLRAGRNSATGVPVQSRSVYSRLSPDNLCLRFTSTCTVHSYNGPDFIKLVFDHCTVRLLPESTPSGADRSPSPRLAPRRVGSLESETLESSEGQKACGCWGESLRCVSVSPADDSILRPCLTYVNNFF